MFNDTSLAELLDHPVCVEADLTLLDVELSQTSTMFGHGLHASIRDHFTTSQRQFSQGRNLLDQCLETQVRDITFTNI